MTALIWLPGMMCDGRLFAPQCDVLGGQVIVSNDRDTIGEMAADILAVAPEAFALAGLSMGGIIAMEVLRQAPARVTKIALMDTNPKAEHPAVAKSREAQIAKVLSGALDSVMRDEMKPNYLTDGPNRAQILDLCMDMANDLGPQTFVNQSRALQTRPDQQQTLSQTTCPALVLCGRDDTLCPVHRHELMHDLMPHSTLQVIDNAGHLPTLEQPEITTQALRRWLENTNG